jgi:dolichyl-phosphate beta-glucosyltransferase
MEPSLPSILLVTPVWNDSKRLSVFGPTLARALASCDLPIQWMIADDGSENPDEPSRLRTLHEQFAESFPHTLLHFADAHHGKGSVIHEAWALAPDATWLAFVDADGSVSADDMLRLIRLATESGQSVLGIRKRTPDTQIEESLRRSFFHHAFLLIADFLLGLRCADPQCGAKVIKASDYRSIVHLLQEDGLAFDSELLAALRHNGFHWQEVPVTWIEKKGGKVHPFRDGWRMFLALLRIRKSLF